MHVHMHVNKLFPLLEATELLHCLDKSYEDGLKNKPYNTPTLDRLVGTS